MAEKLTCHYVAENDMAARYLADDLSEELAEAFEKHYFWCDRCSTELRLGTEVRAAAEGSTEAWQESSRLSRWLAVAAIIALVAIGMWRFVGSRTARSLPDELVLRGSVQAHMNLAVGELQGGQIRIRWAPESGAHLYVVEVLRSDGASLLRRETQLTELNLDIRSLAPRPGLALYARVRALDEKGSTIATSRLTPLPSRS